MEKVQIRPGTPKDEWAIMHVHRQAILQLGRNSYSKEQCESWAEGVESGRYRSAMIDGGETFLLAEGREGLAGFCSYKKNEIVGLYVDPSTARKGIGTQLIRAAEDQIVTLCPDLITLNAALSALEFYQSTGYRVVRREYWKTKGGLKIEICAMMKKIAC